MIIGVGCDIVNHSISQKMNWENSDHVQKRIFSSKEIEAYSKTKQLKFLCGRFAAKEAILKCLSTGMEDGFSLNDVQILQMENGKPYIELSGKVMILSQELGIKKWHISITHSTDFSQAFVIAEG